MKFTRKEFLNDSAEETGFIVVKCTSPREEDLETYWAKNPSCDAEIQIGDCSKKVFLDCSVHKDSDVAKRVAKINVLIDNLTLLRDQLSPTWEDAKIVAQKWLEDNDDKLGEDDGIC